MADEIIIETVVPEVIEVGVPGPQGIQGPQGEPGATDYGQLQNIPSTFPPSAHTHTASDITDFVTEASAAAPVQSVAGRTGTVTLAVTDVANAVSTSDSRLSDARTPTAHTHTLAEITDAGTAAASATTDFATSAQGSLADSAVQPGDLAAVASTGSYADLSNIPSTFPPSAHTHVAADVTDFNTAAAAAAPVASVAGRTGAVTLAVADVANAVSDSDARLSDARTPTAHKASHQTGGTDALSPSDIGAAAASHTHTPSEVGLGNVANAAQVTAVTGTAPIVSSGGTTPAISISPATTGAAGSMSAADKLKLDGIAAGAEVNVNADWNASSGDAQILNKPSLGGAAALNVGTATGTVAAGDDTRFADAAALTTGTLADARLSTNVPLKDASNTFTANQTLDGTNNTAPNQTAASGSSLMTRDLGDDRYFNLRNPDLVVMNVWTGGSASTSGGAIGNNGSFSSIRSNAGAGNRAANRWYLHIGTSRGIDWSKTVRGTIIFNLNGDSRGLVRAMIGENQTYTNGNPTRPCAGFKVTGATLTAFVHDGTTYTEHGTAAVTLSGNNWVFVNRVFEFVSDGAGNISFTLDGATITGGSGARTTQSVLSEAIVGVSESDAACTTVTDIELLRVIVEQS